MSSKKKRKTLKAKYKVKNLSSVNIYKQNSNQVLTYLKNNPNRYVTSKEITNNLTNYQGGNLSPIIKGLIYYDNEPILTKKGSKGGYMYYG